MTPIIYLAPLQGFTDYAFRQAFRVLMGAPDVAFSPFIETHKPDHRIYNDVLPERNEGINLIPQLMGNSAIEMQPIILHLQSLGYSTINLNMGCPYPMVTKRKMGAGLLSLPDTIDTLLYELHQKNTVRFSIKMRLGLENPDDWKAIIPILNRYPLSEVIIHGRTAKQMYKGEVDVERFAEIASLIKSPICYNGNINTLEDFQLLSSKLTTISCWMIGRGLIANPLLINEIKTQKKASEKDIKTILFELHEQLLYQNSLRLQGDSHLFNKMKPYWEYFAYSLVGCEKGLKKIKKSANLSAYKNACNEILKSY